MTGNGNQHVTAIVQTRMNSSRLPGKVLRPLVGRPLLAHLLDSLARCRELDGLVVATSNQASDDPVAAFCAGRDLAVVRGPLEDVAARMALAAQDSGANAFVRVCGDSPLLDHRLVDRAVRLFRDSHPDLVSNVFPRSFPKGQSVEVVDTKAFGRARARLSTPEQREHVTAYFYQHPEEFRITSFTSGGSWQGLQMSVDTARDFALAEQLLAGLDRPHWEYGWRELALRMRDLRQATEGKEAAC